MTITADDYRVVQSKIAVDHEWVRMIVDTLEYHGRARPYIYLESPVDAVATVAVTPDRRIILTRQYRHPIRSVIYDLPAGRLEPGEAPIDGARRELEEETGYRAGTIVMLGRYNQFPGSLKVTTTLFFASDLTATRQQLDADEELEFHLMPVEDALRMVLSGQAIDGSLQLGLLLAAQKGLIQTDHG